MAKPKEIDADIIERLAEIQCTVAEIAAVVGCHKRTIERRFAAILEKGRESGRASIRRQQWAKAKEGNVTMLIWLGKQYLEQRDRQEVHNDSTVKVEYVEDWRGVGPADYPAATSTSSTTERTQ